MKKFSINILKILILLALGLCILSVTSKVNAATTREKGTIRLQVGETEGNIDPGMESKYGGIDSIKVNDKKIVKAELDKTSANKSKVAGCYLKFKVYAYKEGTTTITVKYYKEGGAISPSTETYKVIVKNDYKITLKEGKSENNINPGMISEWGYITKVTSNNSKIATVKKAGSKSKGQDGLTRVNIKGVSEGTATITVSFYPSYTDKKVEKKYIVNVSETVKISKIKIKTLPKKTNYYEGEKFDPTGLTLTAVYSNGRERTITTGFTYSPTKFEHEQRAQCLTIRYNGKTCQTSSINVAKKLEKNNNNNYNNNNVTLGDLKIDDILKLNSGKAWWTYKTHKAIPSASTKFIALRENDKVKITSISGNWLKIKIIELSSNVSKKNFKVGDELYIYYGSTASKCFTKVN